MQNALPSNDASTYSVLGLDCRYTVSQELIVCLVSCWIARFEGRFIGWAATKENAECWCRWHDVELSRKELKENQA